nr:immunoglobulin heavy chain junction region [Macaca mulatta]MOW89419.1 immunoglobulin heavy chain junction region [Macaca mulatta]MOW89437.1 immunoglobulin heavy chain junction region [Macaca mulatta]MOW89821.1 immunoglobulin heavy chain junction region [Macaca mulatta]MOW89916.1 immunoglobulin heavy chain junction region [Macaca mulatta]
CARGHSNFDYW